MIGILQLGLAVGALALAGCVGYGYPGYGGYPSDGYDGYSGGYYPGAAVPTYPGSDYGGTVRCESLDGRTRYCAADVRGGVRLSRRLSRTDCIRGRNWGYDDRGIWVTQGCRAEFVTGGGYGYGSGYGRPDGSGDRIVRCESNDGHERYCSVPIRVRAELVRQLSRTHCVQGRNWRWDRGGIRVSGGCRAEFRVY